MKTTKQISKGYPNRNGIQEKQIGAKPAVVKPIPLRVKVGKLFGWFSQDVPENLSFTKAALRVSGVMVMPLTLSAVDWSLHKYISIFILPAIFYLEVAFKTNREFKIVN